MSTTTITDINDVFGQAQAGSVAAIIQILNERMANSGIRTRAVFVDGVLQLLCEATTPDRLNQTDTVTRIRQILEDISPRRIRHVNINSRLVREQQLLWYQSIHQNPEEQLLWSEQIQLKQPNLIGRIARDLRRPKWFSNLPKGASKADLRQRRSFLSGVAGGSAVVIVVLLASGLWLLRQRANPPANSPSQPATATLRSLPSGDAGGEADRADSGQLPIPESYDPFARAVRIAEQAAKNGLTADTPAEWLALAARWQQASDLMAEVPVSDERYRIAQDRVKAYRTNSEALLQKTEQLNN